MPQIEVTFDIDANGIVHVSAKDMGTGKEQKITISASSGLDEKEIERMVRDASEHSEEDKKRRAQVEARNKLDSLVYSTEKTYQEQKEKLGPAEMGEVEEALAAAKKALEGEDAGELERAAERLTAASHKMAEAVYRQQPGGGAEAGAPGAQGAGGAQGAPSGQPTSDEVIDAEYVDVDKS